MKYISYNLDFKITKPLSFSQRMLGITEQQILELQDLFLSPGFHTITVGDCKEGRLLIYTFLRALRCYNWAGCFTQNSEPLEKDIFDIHTYLQSCGFLDSKESMDLDRFFLEEFDCDFVWIETQENNQWCTRFEQKIQELGIDQQIPILKINFTH